MVPFTATVTQMGSRSTGTTIRPKSSGVYRTTVFSGTEALGRQCRPFIGGLLAIGVGEGMKAAAKEAQSFFLHLSHARIVGINQFTA
jgi:hypothetical protein